MCSRKEGMKAKAGRKETTIEDEVHGKDEEKEEQALLAGRDGRGR